MQQGVTGGWTQPGPSWTQRSSPASPASLEALRYFTLDLAPRWGLSGVYSLQCIICIDVYSFYW